MCDYSLHNVKTRPAKLGDHLITHDFGTGTRGFAASDSRHTAVCVLPGTEIAFPDGIPSAPASLFDWFRRKSARPVHKTAIFRQINVEISNAHHDALEFPDGRIVLLTMLSRGRRATVLQLPVQPAIPGAVRQARVAVVA